MATEKIVSKKFRIMVDKTQRLFHRISFWCKAQDVEFNSGNNAQQTLGNIYGISDSLTSTSSNIAASTAAIKAVNDKITGINLGNATQADVLTGKKFSSQAGLNKIGTMANLNGAVGYGTIQDGTTFARIFLNNTGKITQGTSYVDVPVQTLKDNVNSLKISAPLIYSVVSGTAKRGISSFSGSVDTGHPECTNIQYFIVTTSSDGSGYLYLSSSSFVNGVISCTVDSTGGDNKAIDGTVYAVIW